LGNLIRKSTQLNKSKL